MLMKRELGMRNVELGITCRKFLIIHSAFLIALLCSACSAISIQDLNGPMNRLGNERYGYYLLIPDDWKRSVNSNIRPTQLELRAPKDDATIIVMVMEGAAAPDMDEFIESRKQKKGADFILIRNWPTHFDDMTGYIVNFTWKGAMQFGSKKYGKAGQEYQGTAAMVNRQPTPVLLVCYAEKDKFNELNKKLFGHARDSLKVDAVQEITVRKVRGE